MKGLHVFSCGAIAVAMNRPDRTKLIKDARHEVVQALNRVVISRGLEPLNDMPLAALFHCIDSVIDRLLFRHGKQPASKS